MSYIWSEYDSNNNFEIEEYFFSQFLEAGPRISKYKNYVGVNPLLRFSDIFNLWMEERNNLIKTGVISESDKKAIENVIFHYLALLDRKCGIHLCSVEEYRLEQDILFGRYGKKNKERYEILRDREQKIVLKWLRKHEKIQGRMIFFNEVLIEIFKNCRYYYNEDDSTYIVYILQEDSEYNKCAFEIVKSLFMDVTANVRVFWQYHFGIIGQEDTMKIGNMVIY